MPERPNTEGYAMLTNKTDLIVWCGLCVFIAIAAGYLGFVIGKAYRVPEAALQTPVIIQQTLKDEQSAQEKSDFSISTTPQNNAAAAQDKASTPELNKVLRAAAEQQPNSKTQATPKGQAAQNKPTTTQVNTSNAASERGSTAPNSKTNSKSYTVQITAISDLAKAENMVQSLKQQGFDAYLQTIATSASTNVYRVRVGNFSKDEANANYVRLRSINPGLEPKILELVP